MTQNHQYALVDSGNGRKLERFGPYLLSRPCSQAVWVPQLSNKEWDKADAIFSREQENKWTHQRSLPETWQIEVAGVMFKISPTDFGHLGIFAPTFCDFTQLQPICELIPLQGGAFQAARALLRIFSGGRCGST